LIYLDTDCLLKLYYPKPDSERIANLVCGRPIVFTDLHELECRTALELKGFRKEATASQLNATVRLIEGDVRAGVLHRASLAWEDALREATQITIKHTRKIGCRSLDILHCASALALNITEFVTTDQRQLRLAKTLGLNCLRGPPQPWPYLRLEQNERISATAVRSIDVRSHTGRHEAPSAATSSWRSGSE
jgi:predicted nucleic acid-binding protein